MVNLLMLKNAIRLLKDLGINKFNPLPFYAIDKPTNDNELKNFLATQESKKLENIATTKFFIYTSSYKLSNIRLAYRLGAKAYFTKNIDQDIREFIEENINATEFKVAIRTADLIPQILPKQSNFHDSYDNLTEEDFEILLLKAAGLTYEQIIERLTEKGFIDNDTYHKLKANRKMLTNYIERRRRTLKDALKLNTNGFDAIISKAFLEGIITKEMIDDIKLELSL